MNDILDQAKSLQSEILNIRRKLHRYPEVGKKLPHTKGYVLKKLEEYGYEPREICESGIMAEITGDPSGRTILLRADMDALPVREKVDCDFKSENTNMHACGHDMHTAMLLGAAKLLMANKEHLKGTVRLVFQPDEEGFTGAKQMLKAGVLGESGEKVKVKKADAALALHVNSGTPSGLVLGGLGTSMAGCTLFRIEVKGVGCHGSSPENGVDPIHIAAQIYLALQEIISREKSAMEPAVVTIGKFQAGDAPNIIPGIAVMEGSIRCMSREMSAKVFGRISEISVSMAQAFRGQAAVTELASAPPLYNDPDLVKEMSGYVRKMFGEHSVVNFEQGGMGSEDFASYTYELPCAYLILGAGTEQENPLFGKPMHNEKVFFNEDILWQGAAIHAGCAMKWLEQNGR